MSEPNPATPDAPQRVSSVRRPLGAIILGFEVVVLFLGTLVLYGLDAFAPLGWPDWSALVVGGVLIVTSIVAIALLPRPISIVLGWAVQIVVLLGAVLNLALLAAGVLFGGIWWYAMRAGARLEAQQRARANATP